MLFFLLEILHCNFVINIYVCFYFSVFLMQWKNPLNLNSPSPANNEAECMFMKVLMEKIVTNDSHSISVMTAIHLSNTATQQLSQSQSVSSSKRINIQRAEELVDQWINSAYFVLLRDAGSIILGPRAIAEFRDTLRTKFPDFIQNCHLCSEIAMKVCHQSTQCSSFYSIFFLHFCFEFSYDYAIFDT